MSNRPANSLKLRQHHSKAHKRHSWRDENQLARNRSSKCGTKEHLCLSETTSLINSPYQTKYQK
jgi:hypothetical protein